MSNDKKSEQLGMPFGTASHKLRKLVLFNHIQKYEDNICYRCNRQIDTVDELSIDHKKAWFSNDTALFWDMENIAFSHLNCNIAAANRAPSKNSLAPKGMLWCNNKGHFQSEIMFYRNRVTNKPKDICAPCLMENIDKQRRLKRTRPLEKKFVRGSKYRE